MIKVVVHMIFWMKIIRNRYVALSRVTNIHGLHLLNSNEKILLIREWWMKWLDYVKLFACHCATYQQHEYSPNLVFQNARSFDKYHSDLVSDPNFLAADVNGIAKSRLCDWDTDDMYGVPGFRLIGCDNISNHKIMFGLIIDSLCMSRTT